MIKLLENAMIAAGSIFLVYVGRDHFTATITLIIAMRTLCFLCEVQKKPTTGATEVSK